MNQTAFYILSARDYNHRVSFNCVVEFEDVLVKCLQADLVGPSTLEQKMTHARQQNLTGKFAFIIGISFGDVVGVLRYAQKYLSHFEKIFAYTFDSILLDHERNKPNWKKNFSSYYRLAKHIHHLFIPFEESVNVFANCYQIPVSCMPLAADVLSFGGPTAHKVIDVNGYGRQDTECSLMLSSTFNQRGSGRIYHHTDHSQITAVHDVYAHRRLFWQLLRASKIALAFDALAANNNDRFTFSFVGQRWFESAAAGCVIVGKRPACSDMDKLFFWQDSTLELPDDRTRIIPYIERLLEDVSYMQTVGLRNCAYMAGHHDWRHRVAAMLQLLLIPLPMQLECDLEKLSSIKMRLLSNNSNL